MDGERIQSVQRFAERVQALSGSRVPNLDGAVGCSGKQTLAVGSECQVINRVDVIFECADFFSGGDVPQLDQLVIA
jgi:hypothetical protein